MGQSTIGARSRRHTGYFVTAAGAALALAAGTGGPVGAAAKGATVDVEAANVTALERGSRTFTPARSGQAVATGTTVQTDPTGLAEITYPDGSLTRLDHSAIFTVDRLSGAAGRRRVATRLRAGQAWNRVKQLSGSDRYTQAANGVSASVLGTAFVTACATSGSPAVVRNAAALARVRAAPSCTFSVVEGQVEVSAKGTRTTVSAGQRVSVDAAGTVGPIEAIPPDAVFADPWVAQNLAADQAAGLAATGSVPGDQVATASVAGDWPVTYRVTSAQNVVTPAVGETFARKWTITPQCPPGGACTLVLTFETRTGARTQPLSFANGAYTATDPEISLGDCFDPDSGEVITIGGLRRSLQITFQATAAEHRAGRPTATAITGKVTETLTPVAPGCTGGTIGYDISSTR